MPARPIKTLKPFQIETRARLRSLPAGGPRDVARKGDGPMSTGWIGLALLGLLSGAPADDVVHINQQRFTIPIRVVAERQHEVRELLLFMSRDRGQTWEVYARATPDKKGFDFYAAGDGLFYFSIAVIDRTG